MASYEEGLNVSSDDTRAQQLCIINKQIFAATAVIFAILLTIKVLKGYKRIICNEDLKIIQKIISCNNELLKITILILLITTFYYLNQSLENYQSSNSCENKNYVIANTLSVLATIIRFWTIFNSSNGTLSEGESDTSIF